MKHSDLVRPCEIRFTFTMELKFINVLIIFEYNDIIILGLRVCQCWQHSV